MSEFLAAVGQYGFLQQALVAGALASLACGVVGAYVVVKRISYIAGAIAHSVLGGMGAARYLAVVHGWSWLHPLMGAVVAALAAAMVIGLVSLKARQREDTIIGAVWAVGMALGVVCIALTPGYDVQLMSYLFGNILLVTPQDLWLMGGLDLVVVAVAVLLNRQLLAVCFDQEFARLRGLSADMYYLLLLGLTALTVVLLSTVVGIILVIALLTLPAATASNFARRLGPIMVLAGLISLGLTWGGLALSYGPDLPAGAVIILLAGAVYLLVTGGSWLKKRL
ncbi:MAG: metal ABC transporter permease [Desulfarculaceae bacterium]|nr:metal ABC transporter permease [Desulfarculaceae bacterium]MCF8074251.1 metal ABC transporter permease [Desulfarculaceae bacterium]MCF8102990.1 metal ABC transporter permease [Desulfarculaceae bacterium]MCF8117121.1 metal ABC transporter permease [Desulfarculaceae bacterium]